jgi:hypothetical protein
MSVCAWLDNVGDSLQRPLSSVSTQRRHHRAAQDGILCPGGPYRPCGFPLWGEHIISDIWGQMLPERKQTELYIITGKKILTFITNKLSNKLTSVFRIHISFNKNPDPTLYLNANRDPGNHINKDLDLLTFKFHFVCD